MLALVLATTKATCVRPSLVAPHLSCRFWLDHILMYILVYPIHMCTSAIYTHAHIPIQLISRLGVRGWQQLFGARHNYGYDTVCC